MFLLSSLNKTLIFVASLNAFTAATTSEEHIENLVSWLKEEKGFLNPNASIRRADPNDDASRFGMFATDDIGKNELIFELPRSMIMNADEDGKDDPSCTMTRKLLKELQVGSNSDYAPYVNYLLETQLSLQQPSAWSDAGKELLLKIIGDDTDEPLPPEDAVDLVELGWHDDCGGSEDPMAEAAFLIVTARGWDNMMVPIYDMLSHRNGFWLNTAGKDFYSNKPIKCFANRDIEAGEEIYGSYNQCEDCANRKIWYDTPDIFRDYGFVEQFPQKWIFLDHNVHFEIDENYEDSKGSFKYSVKWFPSKPSDKQVELLGRRIEVFKADMERLLSDYDPKVPKNEWNLIKEYAKAMVFATSFAINTYRKEKDFLKGQL